MGQAAPSARVAPRPPGSVEQHVAARREVFYPKSDLAVPDAVLRGLAAPSAAVLQAEARQARIALAKHLGRGAADLAIEPLPHQGTFHFVFVGGEARERRVVRLNRLRGELVDWQLYADRIVSNALAESGIAHARVLEIDCTRATIPTDFEILEHVAGAPLSTLDADDDALAPWLARLAIALRSVHALPGRDFGLLDVAQAARGQEAGLRGVHARWDEYVLLRLAGHVRTLQEARLVADGEADRIAEAFQAAREALAAVEPRLLHGDPGNHNVIVREGEAPRMVDWEDALLGDPLFDVAFWATFHPERRWPVFFDAYFGTGWHPTRRFWLYFLRVALSKTVHRLRFGYADPPGRPPAAARIQRALAGLAATEGELA